MIEQDLEIDNSSIYTLEKGLVDYSSKLADCHKMYAEAIKKVDDLTLRVEIIIAEVVQELEGVADRKGKPFPPSSIQEVRRTKVPLNKKYRRIKKELAEAVEQKNILGGLVKAFESKGYRLQELVNLAIRRNDFDVKC